MKSRVIFIALSLFAMVFSQKLPGPVTIQAPEFEKDKKGVNLVFDFKTKIAPFTHPNLTLESYKGKQLLLFYFSATCAHCKKAMPDVIDLKNKLVKEKSLLNFIAVSTTQNKKPDIGKFISSFKLDIPVFQDTKDGFSRKYGTGSVPIIVLINEKGHFIKFKGFNRAYTIDEIIAAVSNPKLFGPDSETK